MKKLCHQQVGEENKSLSIFCCDKAADKAFLLQNPYFVATELVTNSVATKPDIVTTKLATNFVATDKTKFCRDRASDKVFLQKNQILSQQS